MKSPVSQIGKGAAPLEAGLYLVATPIGNLRDITLRALDVLSGCDVIACEDTRVTRKLLEHYGIRTPSLSYHEHNASSVRPKIMQMLREGKSVALVSDAGTPLISDPGYKLVRDCVGQNMKVTPVPGASSVLAGLTLSALATDRFFFGGFVPSRTAACRSFARELAPVPATLVLFESPNRLAASLAVFAEVMGEREVAVTRELTKKFEEARRGTLPQLAQHYAGSDAPKGEVVLVIAPPGDEAAHAGTAPDLEAMLAKAMAKQSLRDAVAEVSALSGVPRKQVYELALKRRDGE